MNGYYGKVYNIHWHRNLLENKRGVKITVAAKGAYETIGCSRPKRPIVPVPCSDSKRPIQAASIGTTAPPAICFKGVSKASWSDMTTIYGVSHCRKMHRQWNGLNQSGIDLETTRNENMAPVMLKDLEIVKCEYVLGRYYVATAYNKGNRNAGRSVWD